MESSSKMESNLGRGSKTTVQAAEETEIWLGSTRADFRFGRLFKRPSLGSFRVEKPEKNHKNSPRILLGIEGLLGENTPQNAQRVLGRPRRGSSSSLQKWVSFSPKPSLSAAPGRRKWALGYCGSLLNREKGVCTSAWGMREARQQFPFEERVPAYLLHYLQENMRFFPLRIVKSAWSVD